LLKKTVDTSLPVTWFVIGPAPAANREATELIPGHQGKPFLVDAPI
jgi:hypothetical protein